MRFGLKDSDIDKLCSIFDKIDQIDRVIIYGSRAKGTFRVGSDIDLTIHGIGLNIGILNRIEDEIEELLLPYKLDISIFDHIDNDNLKDHIERIGKIFYKSRTH